MPGIRKLRISDFIFNRRGSLSFRFFLAAFGIALKLFFRRIETANADAVPKEGGLIFVLNHPNGLIDPALVFVTLPRRISFLAKSTLFRTPVISYILKTVEALPVYRRIDVGEDMSKNQETFSGARERLQSGGSIALFPEGVSHNSPKLLPAKTGAARIALGAAAGSEGNFDTMILPVGLFYTNKTTFRSEALLHFGESFAVPHVELDAEGQPPREAVKSLTRKIEDALRNVTLNAATEAELATARIAESIFSASVETENLGDRLEFLRSYVARSEGAEKTDGLREKLIEFDRKLDARGIEPVHLSLSQFSRSFVTRQALWLALPLIVLAPLAIVGAVLHFPAYQIGKLLAYRITHHGADDIASTVKVLASMVLMPLTWLIAAVVIYFYFGLAAAITAIPVSIILGYIALYTLEQAAELTGWARALRLYLTQKEAFLRLFAERRKLTEKLMEIESDEPRS